VKTINLWVFMSERPIKLPYYVMAMEVGQ